MISAETQGGGRWPRLIQAAIDAFSLPDLRFKILFTLGMLAIIALYPTFPSPESTLANSSSFLKTTSCWDS